MLMNFIGLKNFMRENSMKVSTFIVSKIIREYLSVGLYENLCFNSWECEC